jgi:hypothetical protein
MSDRPLAERLQIAEPAMLQEILREAEAYLAAQMAAGTAADQRAYTFAGMMLAISAALVGASYSLAQANPWVSILAIVLASILTVSVGFAFHSARAVDFEFAGNQPSHWVDDVEAGISLLHALAEQCEHYDVMIRANTKTLRDNARWFERAVRLSYGVGVVGAVAFFLAFTLPLLKGSLGG